MAYVDPNAESPQVPATTAQQAPISAGGAGAAGVTKTSAAAPGQNVPAQPSAQLSAYLGANQPQATQFAGQIAAPLAAQTQAAGAAIQPAVNTYTGNLYTVPTNAELNQQVATAPSTLTPEQTAAYQTELGAAAKVPNSASTFETTAPYQSLAQSVQEAVNQANLWNSGNSVANLTTALAPYETPAATTGDRTLDALLVSQTPGAYGQITQAVAPAATLQDQLTAGTTAADQALQAAISQDVGATAAAQAAPQTYASNLTSYLQNAVNTATQGDTAQNAQILSDLVANTPTQADLNILGVTPDQWAALSSDMAAASAAGMPINLSQYLTQTAPNVTAANVATPTQYADVAALQSILGGNAPVEPITATTAGEAGTAPTAAAMNQFNLKSAEGQAKLGPLIKQGQALQQAGAYANSQYQYNHFGGQSPDEFNSYIAGLNSQIAAVNAKIKELSAQYPDLVGAQGVSQNPSVDSGASDYMPVITELGSVAGDISSFLGI